MNKGTKQFTRHVSVPPGEGVRVDRAVTIQRPTSEVYSFWRRLDNLPRFMRHVDSVNVQDDLHSHWVIKTVGGKFLEWDAEMINQRENEMISWRSVPGSEVDNAGSVWFTSVPSGRGTIVRVELRYMPPAGTGGELLAKLFGRDADSEIEEDLGRLKSLLETGHLPEDATASSWGRVAETADTCVRDNPWITVAFVALCGFWFGLVLGARPRRRRE